MSNPALAEAGPKAGLGGKSQVTFLSVSSVRSSRWNAEEIRCALQRYACGNLASGPTKSELWVADVTPGSSNIDAKAYLKK